MMKTYDELEEEFGISPSSPESFYAEKAYDYVVRETIRMLSGTDRIDAQKFVNAVGRDPVDDDLERCNCEQAGKTGHWSCGWCKDHNKPVFACGCIMIKED